MQIGKRGSAVSHISQAYPDRVEVRGRDLCGDVMGRLSFTEYFHLLLTGREPTDDQRFFLDLLLVAIAEHGMMPSNVAARMTLAADPGSLQGAVAAGILGCGPVVLGTSEECARLLEEAQERVASGGAPSAPSPASCRASAIPFTGRSTRGRRAGDPRADGGRTDDMLIVRGVNVFPSAVREVVSGFAPAVSGHILVKPQTTGVKQEPPLPVAVELARGATADAALAEAIRERLRNVLVVQTRVDLVPWGSLRRSEYKSKLVEFGARPESALADSGRAENP